MDSACMAIWIDVCICVHPCMIHLYMYVCMYACIQVDACIQVEIRKTRCCLCVGVLAMKSSGKSTLSVLYRACTDVICVRARVVAMRCACVCTSGRSSCAKAILDNNATCADKSSSSLSASNSPAITSSHTSPLRLLLSVSSIFSFSRAPSLYICFCFFGESCQTHGTLSDSWDSFGIPSPVDDTEAILPPSASKASSSLASASLQ